MKRILFVFVVGCLFLLPSLAVSQQGPKYHKDVLKVVQLEMSPDPARVGQWLNFQAIVLNPSRQAQKVSLFVKDKDEVVTASGDVWLQPGENRIAFPGSRYRFSRDETCFTVDGELERMRRPVDLEKKFCVRKTPQGWTLSSQKVALFVEDLKMIPDPVMTGQGIAFQVNLRNDGAPLRADIRIQDRNQTITQLSGVFIPQGVFVWTFPWTRYTFQRNDPCLTVMVDVDKKPYRPGAAREFCARPDGWSLKPQK